MEEALHNHETTKAIVFLTIAETFEQLEPAVKFLQQAKTHYQTSMPEVYLLKDEDLKAAVVGRTVLVFSKVSQHEFDLLKERFPQHLIIPADLLKDFFICTENTLQQVNENKTNSVNGDPPKTADPYPISMLTIKNKKSTLH